MGDVLHSECLEGLLCVLDDDSPGVGTVLVVVLDHLGQSLTGLHTGLGVSPGDENFVLSGRAQLGDDRTEVLPDVRLRLGLGLLILGQGQTGQYLRTSQVITECYPRYLLCVTHQDQSRHHQCCLHPCLTVSLV